MKDARRFSYEEMLVKIWTRRFHFLAVRHKRMLLVNHMANGGTLSKKLSQKSILFGLKLWVLMGISVGLFTVLILLLLFLCLILRKKCRTTSEKRKLTIIPVVSKDIKEVKVEKVVPSGDGVLLTITDSAGDGEPEKVLVHVGVTRKASGGDKNATRVSSNNKEYAEQNASGGQGKEASLKTLVRQQHRSVSGARTSSGDALFVGSSSHASGEICSIGSPVSRIPKASPYGWGYWYTLRDLEVATEGFSKENVLGEGGYGIVYKGQLADGTLIAVKNLLNNLDQAEKEFRVEVETIGRVRHKNLVRLLGYCVEGTLRMLVYEYVDNGNLEQWLHGSLGKARPLPWEARMKIILGAAKGLAYLHEALEPKVIHRDIKASNILVDSQWSAKVSDFGLAKVLGSGVSHVTTRVMGTFGYVAPEYANTGLLNERSDVYSFGVLLLETMTGRDPVDYTRPSGEVNLVDWFKVMVGSRRSEEVVDPNLPHKPAARILKRALLVALRCVDPDSEKRPKMGHVVHLLESEDFPYRDARSMLNQEDQPVGR
eukprot:c23277_g3_i2 orf=334-1959(-)